MTKEILAGSEDDSSTEANLKSLSNFDASREGSLRATPSTRSLSKSEIFLIIISPGKWFQHLRCHQPALSPYIQQQPHLFEFCQQHQHQLPCLDEL